MKKHIISKIIPIALLLLASVVISRAATDIWVGNTSANFGDANWTGGNNPPLSADSWVFGVAGTSGTALNNNLTALNSVAGITFKSGASAFTFNNNSITLTGDVVNNSTNLETINFPISSTAVRTFTTTTGGGNLSLGGVFSGSGGGITKASLGTLTLNGTAANVYNGATTVKGGSLIVDFTNATSAVNLIDPSSVLVLGGGALQVKQKSGTPTSQTFASTTVNPGFTTVTGTNQVASGALTLALGGITQTVGGTVDFTIPTNGAITTTTANVNGILGGWATTGDSLGSSTTGDWAANDGSGNITNYTAYTLVSGSTDGTGASAQNWKNSGGTVTLTASATINSLVQMNDFSVPAGGTLTLGSGGLMMKSVSRWMTHAGGSGTGGTSYLQSGLATGELYVHIPEADANANNWTIWPIIIDGAVPTMLIKDGPGLVKLGNNNTYTGGTVVNGGQLQLINGGASGMIRGTLTINLGANVLCTVNNAFGYTVGTRVTNAIVNGGTLNTSSSGDEGYNTTFNLTGGTLTSNGGTSASGAASYWVLGQDSAASGGASGINTFPSTITSVIAGRVNLRNDNSNTNEMFNVASGNIPSGIDLLVSAAITGNGVAITLAGAGTTLFSGASTFTGGVIDNNTGTLVIGNNAALGTGLLTMNGGAISNLTGGTFAVGNAINLASTTSVGVNTNDTLTLGGAITGTSGLTKVGSGTLALTGANTYTGTTTVGAGRLSVSSAQSGTGSIVATGTTKFGVTASGASHLSPATLTVGPGATLEFTVSSTTQAPLTPGTLTLNGANTINVVAGNFVAGNSYPLLAYTTLSGTGTLTPGTMPGGVTGTITFNSGNNTYYLNVTSVLNGVWTGAINGTWDINSTTNWLISGVANVYLDGAQVQFDDTGLNTTTVTNLPGTLLSPTSITVTNTANNYAIKTVIIGVGGITKSGTGWLTNSGANTYNGPTVINGGNVVAGVASVANVSGAFGLNSAVSIANTADSALSLNNFATQIGSLTGGGLTGGNVTNGGGTLTVGGDNTSPAAYAGVISGTGGLTKIGTGTLTLSNTNTYTGATTIGLGTFNVTGSGSLGIGTGTMTVGNTPGNTVVNFAGSTMTNLGYDVGTVPGAVGAIYQTAGLVYGANGGSTFQIGNAAGAYGYYYVGSGATLNLAEIGVAGEGNSVGGNTGGVGNGIMDVTGGTVNDTGWMVMTRAGGAQTGIVNIYSGTLRYGTVGGNGLICNWNAGQTAVINVLGGTLTTSINVPINLNNSGNAANLGILNMNGGTNQVAYINGGANGTWVNFNGGTLAADENQPVFMTGLAAASVYSRGGTINNNGFNITIGQQFIAPAGNGVTSISGYTAGAGYIAPPIVAVVNDPGDTTGVGATAIAQINPTTGTVTNVLITCPGVNYTATPTFTLTGGGATTPATITGAPPTANVSGGLTFTGSGTTTLAPGAGAYTYGATLVAGGTLSLSPLTPSVTGLLTVTNAALAVDASSGTPLAISNLTLQNNATNIFSYGTVTANPVNPAISLGAISVPGSGLKINITALGLKPGQFNVIQYAGTPLSAGQFANFGLNPPPGVVGTLSNNTANLSVDVVITSAPKQLAWYGAVSTNWDFSTVNWKDGANDTVYKQYTNGSGVIAGDGVRFDDTLTNDFANPQPTTINLTGTFYPYPVTVDSTLAYSFAGVGGITGPAYLLKINSGSLTLLTSNSFTGGVSIGGGSLIITNDSALGAVSVPLVTLADSTVLQVNGNTTNNTRAFTITGASSIGVLANTVARFGGAVLGGGLTKIDDGTLTLAGNDNFPGTLTVNQGTLNLTASNLITGTLTVNQGTLNTSGANTLAAVPIIGNSAGLNGVLNITGGSFNILNNGANLYSPSFAIGNVAGAGGDVVMSAGTLTVLKQLTVGNPGYGGFSQSGGTTTIGGFIALGGTASGGVFNQSGGTINLTNCSATIGYGATTSFGVMNLSGSAVFNTFNNGGAYGGGVWPGEVGNGTLNVSGTAALTITRDGIVCGRGNAAGIGTVNLNGGTATANSVSKVLGSGTLNFNGGTLKANLANGAFVAGLNGAYIYNRGATIDDGGFGITISQPLLAPTGSGLASIPVTPGSSSGYIDTPIVTITDNAGLGSNAMATATVSGGVVTGIIVTCPGRGFDPVNSSVSVSFAGGGASPTPPAIGTVTYSANGTGGLTKKGSGTLTLTGVNTFTGPITNNAGILSLSRGSTNAGAAVNAGTLSMTTPLKITGSTTVSNGATFTIVQIGSATSSLGDLTVGGSNAPGATLGLGLTGFNPTVPLVNAGTLTFNGTNTISLAGAFNVGAVPLVKYAGVIAGSGTYTNITLPQGVTGFISNSVTDSTLYAVITSTGPGLVWSGFNTNTALANLWDINSTTNWLLGSTTTSYRQPIIPGDAVTFNDSGSGTVILNTNVGPASLVISNNSTSYTFRGIGTISGSTGVQKLGSGTAILNLTNNNYLGDTVISNGILQAGSASAISSSANLSVGSAGTLQLAGFSETINGLSGSGLIDNSSTNAVVVTMGNGNGAVNWSGTINNTGTAGISIIKVGTGNSIITGTNYLTSTAASQINGGTMLITNGGALHLTGGAEFWVMQNAGTATVIVDGGTLDVANNWLVVGRNAGAANGTLIVNSGTVQKDGGGNIVVGSLGATGYLYVNGGQVLNNANLWLGENTGANASLYLNGGLIQATQVRANGTAPTTSIAWFNGGTLQATASSGDFLHVASMMLGNGLVLDDNGFTLSIGAASLQDPGDGSSGGLLKKGAGTVYLDVGNSYYGTTVVTNGTLAGVGAINGPMIVLPAGNLGAGDAGDVGIFTINNNLTLQGKATLRIKHNSTVGEPLMNDQVDVNGNITYGGTLTVTNITSDATPLTTSDTFPLFSVSGSTSGNFTSIAGSPGAGLAYSFNPASGLLSIVASSIASNSTNITFSVSGSTLTLSWPADHLGWILQSQTNSLGVGISTNWADVPGSDSIISTNYTVNPANPTVFYRLRHP